MITRFGKRFLTNYLAGNVNFSQKEIAFGIGSTTANTKGNDTKLEFEFYRMPTTFGSIDIVQTGEDIDDDPIFSYSVVYKATIPTDMSGVISEIGLYPVSRSSANNYDSKFITSFENNMGWILLGGASNPILKLNSTSPEFISKIGESMIQVDVALNSAKEYKNSLFSYDLSGYSINDSISIAYKKSDDNLDKIRIKFYSSATAYCYIDFTPEAGTGDKIQSLTLNNLFDNVTIPAPDLSTITQIGIEVTAGAGGTTTVYFDGIRINDEDTFDPTYGLISRSILASPLTKVSGRPVDIEYKLTLGF